MSTRTRVRRTSEAVRRDLEVAAAIAREAVFATHAARAEAMIQLAGDRVSAPRMLQIYVRLHGLPEQEAAFLTNRVLAEIGRRAAKGRAAPAAFVSSEAGEELAEPTTLLRYIRDRLRGRVMHDLRRGVELYAGVTEVVLLKVHVKHALRFTEILQPSGETISGAVKKYRETMMLRPGLGDMLYYYVLDRIAAEQPPVPMQADAVESEGEPPPQTPSRSARRADVPAPKAQPELYAPNGRDERRARAIG
jgi:hypothetical protein